MEMSSDPPSQSSSQWVMMIFMITHFSPPYLYLSEPCSAVTSAGVTQNQRVTYGDSHTLISTWALAEASFTLNSVWGTLTVERWSLKKAFWGEKHLMSDINNSIMTEKFKVRYVLICFTKAPSIGTHSLLHIKVLYFAVKIKFWRLFSVFLWFGSKRGVSFALYSEQSVFSLFSYRL